MSVRGLTALQLVQAFGARDERDKVVTRIRVRRGRLRSMTGPQPSMELEAVETGGWRIAGIHHRGPYEGISETFIKLFPIAEMLGLTPEQTDGATYVAAYFDDPARTPAEQLHSLAGVTVPEDAVIGALEDERMPAGRYVRTTFIGPHPGLGEAWARFGRLFDEAGYTKAPGASYEVYANTGSTTPPDEEHTDLYQPIA